MSEFGERNRRQLLEDGVTFLKGAGALALMRRFGFDVQSALAQDVSDPSIPTNVDNFLLSEVSPEEVEKLVQGVKERVEYLGDQAEKAGISETQAIATLGNLSDSGPMAFRFPDTDPDLMWASYPARFPLDDTYAVHVYVREEKETRNLQYMVLSVHERGKDGQGLFILLDLFGDLNGNELHKSLRDLPIVKGKVAFSEANSIKERVLDVDPRRESSVEDKKLALRIYTGILTKIISGS